VHTIGPKFSSMNTASALWGVWHAACGGRVADSIPKRNRACTVVACVSMSSTPADTPADAPEHCPGTASADAGKASACEGCPNKTICATSSKAPDPDIGLIHKRMASIKKKVNLLAPQSSRPDLKRSPRSLCFQAREESERAPCHAS
jgi:hypothetical protein